MTNMKQTQDDRTIQPSNCLTIQRVKAYAFTLAETLIVIGIIGVVAALTLPNLNHATGDKEKVTRVKKIYSSLTEAFDRAQAIYGDFDTWFTDLDCDNDLAACNGRFAKRITEFMKVTKDCKFGSGCWSSAPLFVLRDDGSYAQKFENYFEENKPTAYTVLLPDGIALAFNNCWDNGNDCRIRVDIDGPNKGKTQEGNDIFYFNIFDRTGWWLDGTAQVRPEGLSAGFNPGLAEANSPHNFTFWVIDKGNLDYLKCWSELDWNKQTSCK